MSIQVFSSYSEKMSALKNTRVEFAVQTLLNDALAEQGVNPLYLYVNTLANGVDSEVATSVTLYEAALACIESQVMPTYDQGVTNVFNRRYSFAKEDRVQRLDIVKFETVVIDIMLSLAKAPAMELSSRPLKQLDVTDVQAALSKHLPGVALEKVHVSGFVVSDQGKRMLSSSEQLADFIFEYFNNNEIPHFTKGDHVGVYTVAYSEEDADLHPQLTIEHVNDLIIKLAQDFLN